MVSSKIKCNFSNIKINASFCQTSENDFLALSDSMKSFPSGHAQLAFCCAAFFIVSWIWTRQKVLKVAISQAKDDDRKLINKESWLTEKVDWIKKKKEERRRKLITFYYGAKQMDGQTDLVIKLLFRLKINILAKNGWNNRKR